MRSLQDRVQLVGLGKAGKEELRKAVFHCILD